MYSQNNLLMVFAIPNDIYNDRDLDFKANTCKVEFYTAFEALHN